MFSHLYLSYEPKIDKGLAGLKYIECNLKCSAFVI